MDDELGTQEDLGIAISARWSYLKSEYKTVEHLVTDAIRQTCHLNDSIREIRDSLHQGAAFSGEFTADDIRGMARYLDHASEVLEQVLVHENLTALLKERVTEAYLLASHGCRVFLSDEEFTGHE